MKKAHGFLVLGLILALSVIPAGICAVSEWNIGDSVELIVTTTNVGEIDVIKSTGLITVRTPAGTMYDAGTYDVEKVVKPGESVQVPMNWDSSGAPPGHYDILLDGVFSFANGETADTTNEIESAFLLIEPRTGLREVPPVLTEGRIHGITMLSDTYYLDGGILAQIYIENTGNTLFIPEIVVNYECEDFESDPISQICVDDPCEPGLNEYTIWCTFSEEMDSTSTEDDLMICFDVNEHYLDIELVGEEIVLEDAIAEWVALGEDEDGDDLLFKFVIDDDNPLNPEPIWYYDLGVIMEDIGVWPTTDISDGYCFRWFLDGEQIATDPELNSLCEEADSCYEDHQLEYLEALAGSGQCSVEDTELYQFTLSEPSEVAVWTDYYWDYKPAFADEAYHNIEIQIIERTLEYNVMAYVEDPEIDETGIIPVEVYIENTGGLPFEPSFRWYLSPPVGPNEPLTEWMESETYVWNVDQNTGGRYFLEVDVRDIDVPEEGFKLGLETKPVQVFTQTILPDAIGQLSYRFLLDGWETMPPEEWSSLQEDFNDMWTWEADSEWEAVGTHTVIVEVTDDLEDTSGEGCSFYATIDITVTEDAPVVTLYGDTVVNITTEGETNTEEPEPVQVPQNILQSIIQSILNFFQNLFGRST